jgi:serine protease Do
VDANGRVIGVNTVSFASAREGGSDLHFAIPIHIARRVAEELREYGEVRRPWIGWSVAEMPPELRQQLALPEEEGILTITSVVPDSPAARAGIRPGDLLYRIQGLDPYSRARAERILFGTPVGAQVEVELVGVDGQLRRTMVSVIEDPLTGAVREARARRPAG